MDEATKALRNNRGDVLFEMGQLERLWRWHWNLILRKEKKVILQSGKKCITRSGNCLSKGLEEKWAWHTWKTESGVTETYFARKRVAESEVWKIVRNQSPQSRIRSMLRSWVFILSQVKHESMGRFWPTE